MTDAKYTTYETFDTSKMVKCSPVSDSFVLNGQTISYSNMELNYNYGSPEKPIVHDCLMEWPEVKATGIKAKSEEKTGRNGDYIKTTYSMMVLWDLANPEQKKTVDLNDSLYSQCAHFISETPWGMEKDINPERPGGLFTNPVYRKRDKVTKKVLEGRNPTTWVQLNGGYDKTLLTLPNGDELDWNMLEFGNIEIKFIPIVRYEKVFMGGKASLRLVVKSAIVTSVQKVGSVSMQTATMEKLQEKYGNKLQEEIEAQLAQLRMDSQQEQMTSTLSKPELPSNSQDLERGTMESIQTETESQDASKSESLQDFLSPAPSMETKKPGLPAMSKTVSLSIK